MKQRFRILIDAVTRSQTWGTAVDNLLTCAQEIMGSGEYLAEKSSERDERRRVARSLIAALVNMGYTQGQISRSLGVNPGTITRWYSGDRVPSQDKHIRQLQEMYDAENE